MGFAESFQKVRQKSGKSFYRLAQYSGLDIAYVSRLESGERRNPSRDVVLMLSLALVENTDKVEIQDVSELLLAANLAPLRKRGDVAVALVS